MTNVLAPPLWRQLQATAAVLQAIRQGQSGTAALEAVAAPLRPGVQALSFAVLRSLGRAQALRKLLAPRTPPAAADALLCTALALLWQPAEALYDTFTLVNQTVEAAKKTLTIKQQASFINACLRRFLRERETLVAQSEHDNTARYNHAPWWITQLQADWPDHWQAILAANDRQAPLTLRVNTRRINRAAYLDKLQAAGIAATPVADSGLELAHAVAVPQLPGFGEGWVSVQDAAAQLAAPLLLAGQIDIAGLRVLDACAAPGGKTAHLLELSNASVTALDIDPVRCERIHQTMSRLGLTAQVLAFDAADVSKWWDGVPFDAVLLDAPCSASGIVRRHPDIRWLRRQTDIRQLVAIQARLLAALWTVLKPGGRLLYATCSVFKAEGSGQIKAFLASNTSAKLLTSPGHLLPGVDAQAAASPDNALGDHDGFYYALLEKSTA
ncbi:MAG: 16S rRNA (cytosine(967)-C(5))-methyltransferase RsmB [Rhodoferax sp.]|uniref:16S rRNA (cytosine(967)-C(5))-methyltransferase RsmB n=1 Tax=Rhodoferax sp. TaxID=50421 RepID=UPI00260F3514|nr:16S rRNA (cytosine(967)-C(5))-methyltransferase RsmB [Rhodoferax sp.]MDD2882801.1 16S rRNA (cytosine(967)-C(5))-methyltransferase RsmB [Rhodoferax sp.]